MPLRSRRRATLAALALMVPASVAQGDDVVVFAAASLSNALATLSTLWTNQTGHGATLSFGASSALARQIQQGAPADIFISSSVDWIEALEASGDLRAGTRRDILGNTLVLIAHGEAAEPVALDDRLDLRGMLGEGRLAMALVDAVPAGIYGREALTSLGLWDAVEPLVAQSDNVRTALSFVAQNEAPLGIVYATDASAQDNVSIVATFPADSHSPIIYPAALTAQSQNPQAEAFLAFLSSTIARAVWSDYGFAAVD